MKLQKPSWPSYRSPNKPRRWLRHVSSIPLISEAETKRKEEAIKAKAEAEVSEINMERKLKEAEAQKQIEELQSKDVLNRLNFPAE